VEENRDLMFVLSCISMAVASASATVCTFNTVAWMLDGTLFTPRQKWGPLSQIKLTHECLRFSIPKLTLIASSLTVDDKIAIDGFVIDMNNLLLTFMEHSHQC